ncbi:MAG: hypothetical protein ACIPMY_07035 [Rickettsia endosymbiont of Pentastiridius leporinus]
MKEKIILAPLIIVPSEKPGYVALSTPKDVNYNKVILQCNKEDISYSQIKIVRTAGDNPDEAITPATPFPPYTPIYAATPTSKVLELTYIQHPLHNKGRPIGPIACKYLAPEEAPPPIPKIYNSESVEFYTVTCIGHN